MKLHFGHLVGLGALAIGGCAAFFSVYGISQLFAGAFIAVVIMASALEFGKLILASHLQRYWKKLGKVRRTYLSMLVVILMLITSAGIYGLLSSAYQKTYTEYTIMENEVSFLKQKEGFFQSDIDRYERDISQINNNISTLSGAKVSSIQIKDTSLVGGVRNTISTTELRAAQARIKIEESNKKALEVKRITAIDSLNTYKTKILTLQNNTDISGELGPLIYLKELTGMPMDKVVNFFIILLVFVFDPMAIMLVLEANRIFEDKRIEREGNEPPKVRLTNPDIDLNHNIPNKSGTIAILSDSEIIRRDKILEIDDLMVVDPIVVEPIVEPIIEYVTEEISEELKLNEPIVETPKVIEPIVERPKFIPPGTSVAEPPKVIAPVRNRNTVTSVKPVTEPIVSPNVKDLKESSTRKFTKQIPRRGENK